MLNQAESQAAEKHAALQRMRHSAAHVMAEAISEMFPDAKFGIARVVEDGFYYDFDLPRSLTPDDFPEIERRMARIIAGKHPFEHDYWSYEKVLRYFRERGQNYKVEIIESLPAEEQHVSEQHKGLPELCRAQDEGGWPREVSIYRQHNFVDLCRGPHVEHTGQIGPFKLLRVAGAYWQGDENRPMLQRVYGTAWFTQEELDRYLWQLEEAQKRDHRRLGKELELFQFDSSAPGMPYWLPRGLRLFSELLSFWRAEHEKRGYQEISTPLINDRRIWEISGHWEHYRDDMFLVSGDGHTEYGIKPMNCPNAMILFNFKTRSYRDLPMRLSDVSVLHRNERAGTLHGLLRVQKFQQDDAHIFVTEEQIEQEFDSIFAIAQEFYKLFDLNFVLRLGTRPEGYIGDLETWNLAEAKIRSILDKYLGAGNYAIEEGGGAFYGPKIDIVMEDALGRSWQTGTIQLDFQLPRRFNCKYIDKDGQEKTPVVIHRAIFGTLERFLGILIEQTAGAFPVWLAPVQAMIIPISDRHIDYAGKVMEALKANGIRVEIDIRSERMNAKIRDAQHQKIPYMLVVGDKEQAEDAVSVRLRTNENPGMMPVAHLVERIQGIVRARSWEL
ncbi:MAG TPA: threonine--tRNA ligase [Ktedonobacteraceae bacterium]|nr:threonine--tRNA ligase [Ktedonobacteraceae bacterium]